MITRKNIVVVDDSSTSNVLLSDILAEAGYIVYTISDSRFAIGEISSKMPDLILLDLMMPELDGFDLLKIIKSNNSINNIPVIMISAHNDSLNIKKAKDLGAADYIIKPIEISYVLDKIQENLI